MEQPPKKSWKMTGCRGRFYVRGKKNIIYYEAHDRPRSMKLVYSRYNRRIAGELIFADENKQIIPVSSTAPQTIIEAYEKFIEVGIKTKSKGTIRNYFYMFKELIKDDDYYLDDFEGINEEIQNNISIYPYLKTTLREKLSKLRAFFNFCVKRGWMQRNPIISDLFPKIPAKLIEIFSDDEINKIFAHWQKKNYEFYLYYKFLYLTAFRRNEALNLTWEQCLFDNKFRDNILLYKSKYGDRPEFFPLSDAVKEILAQAPSWNKKTGKIFLIKCTPDNVSNWFSYILKKLKIQKKILYQTGRGRSLHTLRKTRITKWILEEKIDPYTLKKLTRDNINTVMKYYAQLENQDLKKFVKL